MVLGGGVEEGFREDIPNANFLVPRAGKDETVIEKDETRDSIFSEA